MRSFNIDQFYRARGKNLTTSVKIRRDDLGEKKYDQATLNGLASAHTAEAIAALASDDKNNPELIRIKGAAIETPFGVVRQQLSLPGSDFAELVKAVNGVENAQTPHNGLNRLSQEEVLPTSQN